MNRVPKTMMTAYVEGDHRTWDEHLHQFQFAYNCAVHSTLGMSPAFLNFGRIPAPPRFTKRILEGRAEIPESDPHIWADRMLQMAELHDLVIQNLEHAQERNPKYFNRGRRDVTYQVGVIVWRRNHVLSSALTGVAAKLAPKFAGPFRISKALSRVIYELEDMRGTPKGKQHVKDLKPANL